MFEELHQDGVNELRQVEIEFPPGGEHLLRLIDGYQGCDPFREVLIMLQPGFGLKDAPRLWLLALKRVTVSALLVQSRHVLTHSFIARMPRRVD